MDDLDNFKKAIHEIFSGMDPRSFWPLNGGQVDAYFDVDEALDMYYRLHKLNETLSIKELAARMPKPDIIRLFLQHNAIIGLKVSKKLNIVAISTDERIRYTKLLFDILREKVKNDLFCLDGKNHLLAPEEVKNLLTTIPFTKPSTSEEKKEIAYLTVVANNLCYSLYYDQYMAGGFYIHGPYDAHSHFGEGTILVIREFHNINPHELWNDLKMPYQKMRIYAVYKNLDLRLNFANHPTSTTSIGDKLIAYKVYLDDQPIDLLKIREITTFFITITAQQTKKINKLHDLDKVRKGAEISYYLFKNLRESMGDPWKPPICIEDTIKKFDDQFIKQFRYTKKPDLAHWEKLFDPRDDYY